MGCDIHGYVEYRRYNDWESWAEDIFLPRDYRLFGLLADVRGDGPVVVPPRGVPTDVSYEVRERYDNGWSEWHTPSWLTADEYATVLEKADGMDYPHEVRIEWKAVLAVMRVLEEARFVFWFDN